MRTIKTIPRLVGLRGDLTPEQHQKHYKELLKLLKDNYDITEERMLNSGIFVKKSGDTMSGDLEIAKADAAFKATDENGDAMIMTKSSTSGLGKVTNKVAKPGSAGYALVCANAVNNEIQTPSFSIDNSNQQITYRGIVNIDGKAGSFHTLFNTGATSGAYLSLYVYQANATTGRVYIQYYNGSGTTSVDSWNNSWNNLFGTNVHVQIDLDYDADTIDVYVNGADLGQGSLASGVFPDVNQIKYFNQTTTSPTSNRAVGTIDEVVLYNVLKGSAWNTADYNGGSFTHTTDTTGLEVGYHCNEGSGTGAVLTDFSGNSRTGTIGSAVTWDTGLVNSPATDVTRRVVSRKDGVGAGVGGINELGDPEDDGETIQYDVPAKATPIDADSVYQRDSADSNKTKRSTWTQIKAFLKTYFDTLYVAISGALGTPSSGTLTNCDGLPDGGLTLTDVATNDSSTSKHGFLKKLDNVATNFMNGQGAWAVPTGSFVGWELIYDSVEDGDVASWTISSLTGNTAEMYMLCYRLIVTQDSYCYLRLNNDSGNNYNESLLYFGTATGGSGANGTYVTIGYGSADDKVSHGMLFIYAKSGFRRTVVGSFSREDATYGYTVSNSWTNTADELTSLVIDTVAGSIAAGSHLTLYKKSATSSTV